MVILSGLLFNSTLILRERANLIYLI